MNGLCQCENLLCLCSVAPVGPHLTIKVASIHLLLKIQHIFPNAPKYDKMKEKVEWCVIVKLRVAAYCRISTPSEEQASSLELQINYYTNLIDKTSEWENAGIFSDVGSGKNTKHRKDFLKMMKLCRSGEIDLILTKSISRFGRNTLDILRALEELRELGIDVWFETEGLCLLQEESRVAFALYSAFAQAESETKSGNIKWGLQHSFQTGTGRMGHFICYGYAHDKNGHLVVNGQQAEIVRLIFQLYLEGCSFYKISRVLESRHILSPTGKAKWSTQTLTKLLSNEKYIGNVLLQKTYVKDFFDGKQVKNTGQREQYYISNHHEAIVSQEVFEKVQEEKLRRGRNSNS